MAMRRCEWSPQAFSLRTTASSTIVTDRDAQDIRSHAEGLREEAGGGRLLQCETIQN